MVKRIPYGYRRGLQALLNIEGPALYFNIFSFLFFFLAMVTKWGLSNIFFSDVDFSIMHSTVVVIHCTHIILSYCVQIYNPASEFISFQNSVWRFETEYVLCLMFIVYFSCDLVDKKNSQFCLLEGNVRLSFYWRFTVTILWVYENSPLTSLSYVHQEFKKFYFCPIFKQFCFLHIQSSGHWDLIAGGIWKLRS